MKFKKILNINLINKKLTEHGLNQSRIADKLSVSREAVSKWFNSENVPSAGKLLQLSKLLNLSFDELLSIETSNLPIVHFRKNASAKTTLEDKECAIDMGIALEQLVPYFPLNLTTKPPVLQNPKNNYEFLHNYVDHLRNEFGISNNSISFKEIISIFNKYNSVIIPVLWHENKRHINALRIYLPESMSTWIYLNLNTKIYDFKFWMAHELGHVIAPDLHGYEGESFSDNFAGALLFPKSQVKALYDQLVTEQKERQKIHLIIEKGKELVISPLSVYMQISAYSDFYKMPKVDLDHLIYKFNSKFNSYFTTVSLKIFGKENPTAKEYINFVNEKFEYPFFKYLKYFVDDKSPSPQYIQNLLDVSFIDAKNLYNALITTSK